MYSSGIARSRWAAIGAAVAVCLGAGGIGITQAATSEGEKAIYKPIEPCRLLDTRAEFRVGDHSALTAGDITLSGWGEVGNCSLPSETTGLSLNVTAIFPTEPTFLTLYPTGGALPIASHLNPLPGEYATPNAVNVDLNDDGNFNVFNLQGAVDVIIDVVGLYDDHNHDDIYYRKGEVYTKDEVDGAIGTGTPGEYYTEDEVDGLLAGKADSSDVYTRDEVDAIVDGGGGGGVSAFAVSSAPVASVPLGGALDPALVVASVTVNAPAAGRVVLNYSTYMIPSNETNPEWAGCSVGTVSVIDLATQGASVEEGIRATLSGTRLVNVAAGPTTFNMVCDALAGSATSTGTGSLTAAHPTLTALYTPAP